MGKPNKSNLPSAPTERSIKTRSVTLRKRSTDEQLDSQIKSLFDGKRYAPRDPSISQPKSKYSSYNEDIDMYFASCFNPTFKVKDESQQVFEKESISQKNYKENKKIPIGLIKHQVFDQGMQSQIKSELESIEEEKDVEKLNFEQEESPESPIFGRKLMKDLRTPPNKLVDLKDFDQSEEIVRRNFIDQLDEVSKDVSSPSDNRQISPNTTNQIAPKIEFSSPTVKKAKRITKRKKTPEVKKKIISKEEYYFQKPDDIEFSFRRHGPNNEIRRLAHIIKNSTIKSLYNKYEKTERNMMSLDNALKSLMNYFQLTELNPKVLMFRGNVYKLLKQEIDKMLGVIRQKKEICVEVIQERSKDPYERVYFDHEKMDMSEME